MVAVATAGGISSQLAGGSFEMGFITAGAAYATNYLLTQSDIGIKSERSPQENKGDPTYKNHENIKVKRGSYHAGIEKVEGDWEQEWSYELGGSFFKTKNGFGLGFSLGLTNYSRPITQYEVRAVYDQYYFKGHGHHPLYEEFSHYEYKPVGLPLGDTNICLSAHGACIIRDFID